MTGTLPPALVPMVALSLIPGLGGTAIQNLLDRFGTLDEVFSASRADLMKVPRIGPKLSGAILAVDLERTSADLLRWLASGVQIALRDDARYPRLLRDLSDAPPVLFWRGDLRGSDTRAVALVGTRTPTGSARRTAEALAGMLVACGCTVASGLAAGIDSAAHKGALRAGGCTVAVLGSGVHRIYPPANRTLAQKLIEQGGAVVAEVQPYCEPNPAALVARNRIITGMSRAVVVVEAGEASGALHAARFAWEQGRTVYAVDCAASGSRELIARGAHPLPPTVDAWHALADELKRE